MLMIDATKWEEFYKKMTDDLKPYDHYDDGDRDAMDNVDDWMDGNQVEAEPVRHGTWEMRRTALQTDHATLNPTCNQCGHVETAVDKTTPYCPICGAKMDGR